MTFLAFNVDYVFLKVILHYGFFRDKTRQFCSFAKMFTRLTKSAKWKGTNYIWTMQNLCNIYCCERLTILHSFCTEVGIVNAKKYVMPKFRQRSDLLSFKLFLFFSSRSAKWEICQNNSGSLEKHETCFAFRFVTFF